MQWVQENKLYAPEISTNSVQAVLIHSWAEVSIRGMSYASAVKTCVLLHLSPSHSFRHRHFTSFPFPPRDNRLFPRSVSFPFLIPRPLDPRTLILKKNPSFLRDSETNLRSEVAEYTRKDNALVSNNRSFSTDL